MAQYLSEHELYEEYFEKSREDLISIIISLEVELAGLENLKNE